MTIYPLILAFTLNAAGQPQPQSQPEAMPLTPALVLSQVSEVYRAGPIADEVTVQLTTDKRRSRSATLIVRLNAHQPDVSPLFRIEFDASLVEPRLVVFGAGRTLSAANTDNENDRWVVTAPGSNLAQLLSLLPPIPVPSLHFAFDSDGRFDQPTPYTPDASWFSAESRPSEPASRRPATIVLRGHASSGPVEASFDASSLRFRSFHADLPGGTALDLTSKAIPPGDPASWPINTAGRRIVPDLAHLTPQRGPIPPGDFVPNLGCALPDGTGWNLHAALASLPRFEPGAPASAIALILFRVPGEPVNAAEASARLALSAIQLAANQSFVVLPRPIAAIDLGAYGEQWPNLEQRWGAETASGLAPGWATPSNTINRFAPSAQAALILIAPDRHLLAVIALDDQTDAVALADEIRAALRTP